MTKLIYITHPAVEVQQDIPVNKWHISDDGWKQTMRLVRKPFWAHVDTIYSSQEPKAKSVADEVEAHHVNLKFPIPFGNEELGEIDRSSTGYIGSEGYPKAMEQFYLHPSGSYNGWETAEAATERTLRVISHIMDDNLNKTVAIIGHGAVGTLLICYLKNISPTMKEDPKVPGCLVTIDWDNKKVLSEWITY